MKKVAAFVDLPLVRPLEFDPIQDCSTQKFQAFKKTLNYIEDIAAYSEDEIPPLIFAELEQSLYASILGTFNHNYSAHLERPLVSVAPWQVRRVEEYIEANWNHPLMIEDIVSVVGCSARSLFRTFRESRGYSPMDFVKRVRMRHAREMLLHAKEKNVTRVAFACGFSDLGRFSREYCQAFGELPSYTLKRAHLAFTA